MDQPIPTPPTPEEIDRYHAWWSALSAPWKTAYNQIMLRRDISHALPDDVLHTVWTAIALRFAGPTAPYPNMTFELDNLDGLPRSAALEIFVFTHHKIHSLAPLVQLPQLKSVFAFDNALDTLDGLEALGGLQELYCQSNRIKSLRPLEHLTQLHTVYCPNNRLQSLEGIGAQHTGTLSRFACLPNDELPDAEVIRMEREVGIRCQKG